VTRHKKVTPGPVGPDVDLEVEDLRLPDGSRLTEERATELAERALARRRGRPTVTGDESQTPSLTVRVSPTTRAALEQIAAAQGRRLADVGREAFEEYIRRHAS
jgi:hypothetical protein